MLSVEAGCCCGSLLCVVACWRWRRLLSTGRCLWFDVAGCSLTMIVVCWLLFVVAVVVRCCCLFAVRALFAVCCRLLCVVWCVLCVVACCCVMLCVLLIVV